MAIRVHAQRAHRAESARGEHAVRSGARPHATLPIGRCACGGGCPRCIGEAVRSPSHAIDSADREFLEPRFGRDLHAVRLHSNAVAATAADALGARAWTLGNNIVLGRDEHRPRTEGYRQLLAHELVHVLQQEGAGARLDAPVAPAHGALEREARQVSAEVLAGRTSGGAIAVGTACAMAQRELKTVPPFPVRENLAHRILGGARTVGFVLYVLNDQYLNMAGDPVPATATPTSPEKARARAALARPKTRPIRVVVPEGTSAPDPAADHVISEIPTNTLVLQVHTLLPPPWMQKTYKKDVLTAVPDVAMQHCVGTDPCEFTAHGVIGGSRDDAAFMADTLAHENQHAADIATAFETVFRPWDDRMYKSLEDGEVFSGTTSARESAMWAALGASPDAIADAFVDEVDRLGKALHKGLAHPAAALKNASAAPDCSTAEVDVESV